MKNQVNTSAKMREACYAELESLNEFLERYKEALDEKNPGCMRDNDYEYIPLYRIARYVYIVKCRTINAFLIKYGDLISKEHEFFRSNAFDENVAQHYSTSVLFDHPKWIVGKATQANTPIPCLHSHYKNALDKLIVGFVLYNLYKAFSEEIPHASMRADYIAYHLFRKFRHLGDDVKFLNPINI